MEKPENFTRLSIRTVYDSLRLFCKEHGMHMGVDESHPKPSVYEYVFCKASDNFDNFDMKGLTLFVDYERVIDLDETIDTMLEHLRKYFTL